LVSSPRKVGRPPKDRPDAREELLSAASALMIEKDTIDIPLSEIAQRAGLNSALVSYHFGGKEGLLLALAKRDTAKTLREMDALMTMDIPPEEKLRKHLAGVINFNFRFPYMTRLVHALLRDAKSASAREITEFFTLPVTRAQAKIIEDGVKSGRFAPVNTMLFYFSSVGACDYLFWGSSALQFVFGIDKVDDDLRRQFIDHTVDLMMKGCLAPAKS
jgi:AcrR family transcriptional regulator